MILLSLVFSSSVFAQVGTNQAAEGHRCLSIAREAHEQKAAHVQLAFQDGNVSAELAGVVSELDRNRRLQKEACTQTLGTVAAELLFSDEQSFNKSQNCVVALIAMRQNEKNYIQIETSNKMTDDTLIANRTRLAAVRRNNSISCTAEIGDRSTVDQLMLQF